MVHQGLRQDDQNKAEKLTLRFWVKMFKVVYWVTLES